MDGKKSRTSARPGPAQRSNPNGPNTPTPSSRRPINTPGQVRPNPNQAVPGPGTPANRGSMSPQQMMLVNQAREQVRDGPGVLPVPQKKWYGESRPQPSLERGRKSRKADLALRSGSAGGSDHLADKLMGEDPCKSTVPFIPHEVGSRGYPADGPASVER